MSSTIALPAAGTDPDEVGAVAVGSVDGPAAPRPGDRAGAIAAGVCFVVAAVAAVVGLALYQPLLGEPDYVLGAGADARITWGAVLELLVVATVIGTSVALYPVLRRVGERLALAYVCGRVLEAVVIAVGIISVLGVVTLRTEGTAGDDALVDVARSLVAVHDWTFLVGPGVVIGVNTFVLAWLVLRGGLAPRWIPIVGLVGGPLVLASSLAVLFGAYEQASAPGMLAAIPVATWEMALAVWLIARGGRPSAAPSDPADQLRP